MGNLLRAVMLGVCLTLTGCVTMQDGSTEPDYALIEFGAVAAMSVIVNETEAEDAVVVQAYDGLKHVEAALQCVGESCPPLDISIISGMLQQQVPLEYRALVDQGMKLAEFCNKKLDDAQKKINIIMDKDGVPTPTPFDFEKSE